MLLLTSALLILNLTQRTLAQSTVSLFIPSFGDDSLQGERIGVGADGTTFALSGSFTTGSFVSPFTMTIVEAASEVIEIAAVRTGSGQDDVVGVGVECELRGKEADCVQVFTFAAVDRATTLQGSISIQPTAVPIVSAQTGSASVTGSSTSNGGSGETNSASSPTGISTQTAPAASTTTQTEAPPEPTRNSAGGRQHSMVVVIVSILLLCISTMI